MIITAAAFEGDYHHHPLGWLVTVISAASTTRKVSEEGEGVFEGKILNLDSILSLFSPSEYNDVYDEYSRSVEEESCISPRTGKLYLVIKMMTISKRLLFLRNQHVSICTATMTS